MRREGGRVANVLDRFITFRAAYHEQKKNEKQEKKGQKRGRSDNSSNQKNETQKEKTEEPKKEHVHGKVIHITNIGPGGSHIANH